MNLFKVNPQRYFEVLLAMIFTALILGVYVGTVNEYTRPTAPMVPDTISQQPAVPAFSVTNIIAAGPSYAQHNFDTDPNGLITVFFNEEVDAYDVTSKVVLKKVESGEQIVVDFFDTLLNPDGPSQASWQSAWKQKVLFTPAQELEPATAYEITILPGYFNKEGTYSSARGMTLNFTTSNLPGFLTSNVEDNVLGDSTVRIIFTSPMSKENVLQEITTTPEITDLESYLAVYDKTVEISAEFEPNVSYEITIPDTTLDAYGRPLGEVVTLSFVPVEL